MSGAVVERTILDSFQAAAMRREGLTPPVVVKRGALLDFCERRSVPTWVPGKHLALIADALQRAIVGAYQGKGINLILQAPPRHGKSHLTSILAPVWALGRFKDLPLILATYGAKLASSKAREARNLMELVGAAEFDVRVDQSSRSVVDWHLLGHRGRMLAVGRGGPVTGEGALLGIIDDPYKNYEEAHSPDIRETLWTWYRSAFATRIEPGGSKVMMMTRWTEDDLIGQAIKEEGRIEEGGAWEVIDLPAECIDPKSDRLKRSVTTGDRAALWPVRWPWRHLQARKKILGSYLYSAMFQQRPQPSGTTLFKRQNFRYWRHAKDPRDGAACYELGFHVEAKKGGTVTRWERVRVEDCWTLITCDTALSLKRSADYFVMQTWAVTRPIAGRKRRVLVDQVRERIEAPEQIPLVERTAKSRHARLVGIEDAQAGMAAFQYAKRRGLPMRALKADKAKEVRALPYSAAIEAEDVFFPHEADWLSEFEAEHTIFPFGKHDDQVDCGSYMEITLRDIPTPTVHVGDVAKLTARVAERARKNGEHQAQQTDDLAEASGHHKHLWRGRLMPPARREGLSD